MKTKILILTLIFSLPVGFLGCQQPESRSKAPNPRLDKIPDIVFESMTADDGLKFVGHSELSWDKRLVTVSFESGDADILELIESTAEEWTNLGGDLKFSFRNPNGSFRKWTAFDSTPVSDIRISFRSGSWGGYWSAIGVLAENFDPNHPTMNLEKFDVELKKYLSSGVSTAWDTSYDKSTILHEFGHALGLAHEHFHPKCQDDMKKNVIIKDLMGPPNNWSEKQAKFNIDYSFYLKTLIDDGDITKAPITSVNVDQDSLLLYSDFPASAFKSGNSSPCLPKGPQGFAINISAQDREYYLKHYGNIPSPF